MILITGMTFGIIFLTGMTGMALLTLARLRTNAMAQTAVPALIPVRTKHQQ